MNLSTSSELSGLMTSSNLGSSEYAKYDSLRRYGALPSDFWISMPKLDFKDAGELADKRFDTISSRHLMAEFRCNFGGGGFETVSE